MFIFVFVSQFLCHMPQRNWILFSILIVAMSHCNRDLFCLSHWVTATNRLFVCCFKSEWQTKFVNVSEKMPKRAKNAALFGTFCNVKHLLCLFGIFSAFLDLFSKFLAYFGIFLQHIQILFVAVTQCDKHKILCVAVAQCNKTKFCLSQWLSATNNTEKNIQFLCCM